MDWSQEEETVSFEDAINTDIPRIMFMGPRRSGKSSIERVVFHKMSPHETLFLESTNQVDIKLIANNSFVKFQTWDFCGDRGLFNDVYYDGKKLPLELMYRHCSTVVYVIDAQEDDFMDALPRLAETILKMYELNPSTFFEIFLHKVDGDIMSEEIKAERQQDIQHFLSSELAEIQGEVQISYYLTSVYDHSALEAFSKVVQKLVPSLHTLNNLLDILIASSNIDKSYLVDVVTKLYIATDSNPVDVHTYELCSDLVDVVVDVSCIYGVHANGQAAPYDNKSTSAIRLNSGMVLYFRQVSHFLALICVLREENFAKRSLLDYNIDCYRDSLEKLFLLSDTK